jgi:hypothetical protein
VDRRWRRERGGPAVSRPSATPEHTPLDGLLGEVRDLRLTLASDLSLAASAAEAGADEITRDILESDQRELARFVRVAEIRLARLQGVVVPEPRAPRWRRRVAASLPAVPLVGAMALSAAAATGVLPLPAVSGQHNGAAPATSTARSSAPVDSTFQQFVTLVDGYPSASQVLAAAAVLHKQLADMIASNAQDPTRMREIEQLLQMEQSLLLRRQPPGTPIVLAAAHRLAASLVTAAKPVVATSTLVPTPATSTQKAWKTSKTSPTPTATKTSTAQPAATPPPSTAPSAAPTPTPTTSSSSNQIPNIPG